MLGRQTRTCFVHLLKLFLIFDQPSQPKKLDLLGKFTKSTIQQCLVLFEIVNYLAPRGFVLRWNRKLN